MSASSRDIPVPRYVRTKVATGRRRAVAALWRAAKAEKSPKSGNAGLESLRSHHSCERPGVGDYTFFKKALRSTFFLGLGLIKVLRGQAVAGIQLQRFLKLPGRVIQLILFHERHAEVQMRQRIAGLQLNDGFKFAFGFGYFILQGQFSARGSNAPPSNPA